MKHTYNYLLIKSTHLKVCDSVIMFWVRVTRYLTGGLDRQVKLSCPKINLPLFILYSSNTMDLIIPLVLNPHLYSAYRSGMCSCI